MTDQRSMSDMEQKQTIAAGLMFALDHDDEALDLLLSLVPVTSLRSLVRGALTAFSRFVADSAGREYQNITPTQLATGMRELVLHYAAADEGEAA